jgi:hypothetical protein
MAPLKDASSGRFFLGTSGAPRTAEGAVVVMVSTLVTGLAFGVTDGGTNMHRDSAGSPLQEKLTI